MTWSYNRAEGHHGKLTLGDDSSSSALPWVKALLTRIWCAWPVEDSSMPSITTRYAACSRDRRFARSWSGKWQ